jgi:hypothetical protein
MIMRIKQLFLSFLLLAGTGAAQFRLRGIVDLHVYTNPDSAPPRRTDIFEIAQAFKRKGIRAYVIKSHFLPTLQLAYVMNKVIPEVGPYGGIVLNWSVGGINPLAVEHFAMVTSNYAPASSGCPLRTRRTSEAAHRQASLRAGLQRWRAAAGNN